MNKKCGKVPVSAIIVGVVALWLIWFGSASVLTQELVEGNLKQISDKLVAEGKKHDRDVKLNYGAVEISGWLYNKSAVVKSVSIEIGQPNFPDRRYSFVLGDLTIEADAFGLDRIVVSAKEPVQVVRAGKNVGVVKHSSPFRYIYSKLEKSGKEAFYYDFLLPKDIQFADVDDKGDILANSINVTFSDLEPIHWSSTPSEMASSMSYNFSGVNISNSNFNVAIDNILGKMDAGIGASPSTVSGQYSVALANLVYSQEGKTSKPYNFNLDIAFNNDVQNESASPNNVVSANSEVTKEEVIVNNALLGSPEFSINATGTITTASSDPLPYGDLKIKIDSLPQFLNSEVVPEQLRGAVTSVLEKVAGQPIAGQSSIEIPVKRETNNVLFIGKTTFEELAGSFIAGALTGGSNMQVPSNQLTPAPVGAVPMPSTIGGSGFSVPVNNFPPVSESGAGVSQGSEGMTGEGGAGVSGSVGGADGQPPIQQQAIPHP